VTTTVDIWATCLRVTPDNALTTAKLTPSSTGTKVKKGR
jgi:hypothetical protein